MRPAQRAEQDLVLVGGGHTHALALRALAMQPVPGLRVTLVSPAAFTPYSGMLPGLLAGHYEFTDAHIDLVRLCQWADVRFIADEVTALDPQRRVLRCREHSDVHYDIVSLDIGSQPELDSVPGAREYSTPVKPVAGFWARWLDVEESVDQGSRIAVVGGGAGSVEVALAMAHRLREREVSIALYCAAAQILPGYPAAVQGRVAAQCAALGVALHVDHRVTHVDKQELHFSGRSSAFDTLFWCTGAAAAPWVSESGLPVDKRGFLEVHDTLQSTADPRVFAAGDIATQIAHPRPKAGVYAVRQAPVLSHNLRAIAEGKALRDHRPQKRFLSLLSLGPRGAVAERNGFTVAGAWVWRWKDRIDREFMDRFAVLPERAMAVSVSDSSDEEQAPCGGCGAKVAGAELHAVLGALRDRYPDHTPTEAADDVAVITGDTLAATSDTAASIAFVQSTDQLRALVDDPWLMGRIAAQHALSDLYASGAQPHSALAQVTLPFAAEPLLRRDLEAALDGALSIFAEANCRLLGGHSMQGPEMQLGFTVNGVLRGEPLLPKPVLSKQGAQPGDVLLLSKALGSGALFAAHMQQRADGRHVQAALEAMQQSNREASLIARRYGARAVTDVTGFGLAGHLLEMLGEDLSATLQWESLPVLAGALEALNAGIRSTAHTGNVALAGDRVALPGGAPPSLQLLFDPQTSGGLLMAVPPASADAALAELNQAGPAAAIGEVEAASGSRARVSVAMRTS